MLIYLILCDGEDCEVEARLTQTGSKKHMGPIIPEHWSRDPVYVYKSRRNTASGEKVKHFCPECTKKRGD